jgi:hydrogenase nickel incorporation protein HypA/HybF
MGIADGILTACVESAAGQGAVRINRIDVRVGELTQVMEDALHFAFEALRKGTMAETAELHVAFISPRSKCLECGVEFDHGRYEIKCPSCGAYLCELLAGRELAIDSMDID